MITVIQTMCRENYAAHNGFTGEYYWKNKSGSTYIVESTDPAEIKQVVDLIEDEPNDVHYEYIVCLLYTSPSPRDLSTSRMPSSA